MINGIIFQRIGKSGYMGVEGDNWYLNDIYPSTIGKYHDEYIEKSWCEVDWVDVCNNEEFIEEYIRLSKENNINFRMILCQTNQNNPRVDVRYKKISFLGYDYAYSGGSYYSAVYSDLFCGKLNVFSEIELNENGLIKTRNDLKRFIDIRNRIELKENTLEKGDFIEYKLFQINLL